MQSSAVPGAAQTRARGAWYVVALLAAMFAMSFIDRFMLALVIGPVSSELGIGDRSVGLLLGAGFAVVYAIGGLPIAQALDVGQRRLILVGGVTLWSVMTIASGLAGGFVALAVCRGGVALGEAVLTPAAVSLIADLFPREKRALPIAIYTAVGSLMATGAFLVNGAALRLAASWSDALAMAPWRLAFVVIGVPGLILATIFLVTVREPVRTTAPAHVGGDAATAGALAQYLARHWRFYLPHFVGTGLLATYSFAMITWVPTLLVRRDGMDPSAAGALLAGVVAPCALVGTFFWPWLAVRLERRGAAGGIMTAYLIAALIAAPLCVFAPLAGSVGLMLAGLALAQACLTTAGAVTPLVVQSYGPARMRARLMALTLLAVNLFGYSLGPVAVVAIAGRSPGDPGALAYGLSGLALVTALPAIVALSLARWAVGRSSILAERD